MPNVVPVQASTRGRSTRWSVDVIVPGPAFQRKPDPSARPPCIETARTSGFQVGHASIPERTSQTTSGAAEISVSLTPTTGACPLIAWSSVSGSSWMMRVFNAISFRAPGSRSHWQAPPARKRRQAGQSGGRFTGVCPAGRGSRTEVEQHGEDSTRVASRRGEPQLAEDRRDVLLDRSKRDHELVRDSLIRSSFGHEGEHIPFTRRQFGEWILTSLPREQCRDDDRIEGRATCCNSFDGADELVEIADPIFQQVADALGGIREQLHRKSELDVLRQHEDAHRWMARSDLERRAQALVVVCRWQPDVDDRDVHTIVSNFDQQVVGIATWRAHVEPRLSQKARHALAQQHAVLGDRYPHGISAFTRVPPPCGVQTLSRPPSDSTRSASPRRPEPVSVSAPPIPSSTISTRT